MSGTLVGATLEQNVFGLPRESCAAFTGYRPAKFRRAFPSGGAREVVAALLRPVITAMYRRGVTHYLTGMADGFDIWAAAEVLALRDCGECPTAGVVAVVPYRGHSERCDVAVRSEYARIMSQATHSVTLADAYAPDCFLRRNDFLVDNASAVICYYDGLRGGTGYTVARALRHHLRVVNLCDGMPLF